MRDKKSITITPFRVIFLEWEIYKEDKKLKHSNIIKNWSLKILSSNTLKFNILNISIVSFLCSNNGAKMTAEPFKKNKNSVTKNFFLK